MCTTGSDNPFVTPRRVIRLDYNLQEWLDWAEPAKAAAVLMIKEDNVPDTNLLKTLEALVAAYDRMSFVSRYPLDENIEDIKAHIEKLRGEGAADMQAETAAERAAGPQGLRQAYPPVLPVVRKYQVTLAADLRAYATVTVEAPDEDVAWNKVRAIMHKQEKSEFGLGAGYVMDLNGILSDFEPDYDTLDGFELLEDLVDITDH